jgi:hypothetical protein
MTRNTERAASGLDGEYVPSTLERVRKHVAERFWPHFPEYRPLAGGLDIPIMVLEPSALHTMASAAPEHNKALVLEAFDTLVNRCDYAAAQRFWSADYIQHSAHIPPGRDGLFNNFPART